MNKLQVFHSISTGINPWTRIENVPCVSSAPCPLESVTQTRLDGASRLQQSVKLALLGLQVAVATNVLLLDEDIGHAALAGDFLEGVLDGCAVFYD
jgi:hypothetical protein